jgi:transcriptional regulator with XRE-family HTH domain
MVNRRLEKAVGAAIRIRRKTLRLTQSQLGSKLLPPVSHAAISDIERGKTTIGVTRLRDIALTLGTTSEQLLFIAQRLEIEDLDHYSSYWKGLSTEDRAKELEMMATYVEESTEGERYGDH